VISKIIIYTFLWCTILCNQSFAQSLQDTTFITEDLPPYNYLEDGHIKGISIDILNAALTAVGIKKNMTEIEVYPWARGFRYALEFPNTCLFSTVRSKERENLFKWAGPITIFSCVFISKKGTVNIKTPRDAINYRISTLRKGVAHEILLKAGCSNEHIDLSPSVISMVRKLKKNRIDALFGNQNAIFRTIIRSGFSPEDYEVNYTFNVGEIYFAFNKKTPDSIVLELQRGIDIIRKNGKLGKIISTIPSNKK